MKLKCFALTAVIAFATNCMAQGALEKSTVVNKDGTVTFKYWNDYAKDVQVDVQFAGRKPMTKGADGVWTATLGPAAPDMYPYCFIVDGIQVMDPRNQLEHGYEHSPHLHREGSKRILQSFPSFHQADISLPAA